MCVWQIRDAQQDGESAFWPAAGVILPCLRYVSEAFGQTGGGHGETHQPHGHTQAGEEG